MDAVDLPVDVEFSIHAAAAVDLHNNVPRTGRVDPETTNIGATSIVGCSVTQISNIRSRIDLESIEGTFDCAGCHGD